MTQRTPEPANKIQKEGLQETARDTKGFRLRSFAFPLTYMAAIFLLSSIPDDGTPESLPEKVLQWASPGLQNLLHLPLFGGLAVAWYRALRPIVENRHAILLLVFLVTTVYAFLDEWHQLYVPGRYGSWTDVLLNLTGIIAALWIMDTRTRDTAGKGAPSR